MKKIKKFTLRMQRKLVVLFILVLAAFIALSYKLYTITRDKGDAYKRQVLAQQHSGSTTLPFRRGDIVDRKGSRLAYSEKVYNLVVDAKQMNEDDGIHLEPTYSAIKESFPEVDIDDLRDYVTKNPGSRYRIFAKKLSYDEVEKFEDLMKKSSAAAVSADEPVGTINGVWFEEDYTRKYPYDSLACDVVGFVQGNNVGFYGLEGYYNDTLNGINGRSYSYLNDEDVMEDSIQPATDGKTLVTTLDVNVQSIVEKHIKLFYEKYKNNYREGAAAENIGVIVMNPNNGEVYAMAGYPVFNLNDPENMDDVDLTPYMKSASENTVLAVSSNSAAESASDETSEETAEENTEDTTVSNDTAESAEVSANQTETLEMDDLTKAKNAIWRNFCISDSYEPGSVMKPFTVAGALDAGKITGDESYECGGYMEVGGFKIHCHNRLGDGLLTVQQGMAKSCNVVLMNIAFAMGKDEWLRYNRIFNFGLKTNIDLYGETNASSVIFDETMGQTDLAVASFGQGFNVTMIQMAAGFSALINGGYYYQPHLVSEVENSDGAVIEEKEPKLLKQVISESTSKKMREILKTVVMSDKSECTGWSARPAGYTEGGKTGTAEKIPRGNGNYLISFMGYVPADDPQVLCYVIIDTPNHPQQSESTRMATVLNKDIMTEVLPYLNIFPTEPLTEEELASLSESQEGFFVGSDGVSENSVSGDSVSGDSADGSGETADDGTIVIDPEKTVSYDSAGRAISQNEIKYDEETGYPLDPATGEVLDPVTLQPINGNSSFMTESGTGDTQETAQTE
ncbi:peptidoglycan D,D-transpeptidase FtsI family protein [Lachnospiraceae bacterium C1.1]|nr:penicillin-binding protein 2 [Lachnospiraceae bacterium C1.1]